MARFQTGLTLVDLMIGMGLSLFLLGGVLAMLGTTLLSSRNMLLQARMNQDLRTALDLISRDIKRAGYWADADISGTLTAADASTTLSNPYTAITCTRCDSHASQIEYVWSKDTVEDNIVSPNTEQFGFKLLNQTVYAKNGNNWQALTDPENIRITAFQIAEQRNDIPVPWVCDSTPISTPTVALRRYDIVLTAQSAGDATLTRSMSTSVRVRNEMVSGQCT